MHKAHKIELRQLLHWYYNQISDWLIIYLSHNFLLTEVVLFSVPGWIRKRHFNKDRGMDLRNRLSNKDRGLDLDSATMTSHSARYKPYKRTYSHHTRKNQVRYFIFHKVYKTFSLKFVIGLPGVWGWVPTKHPLYSSQNLLTPLSTAFNC